MTDRDELAMLIEPHMQGVGWHDRARQIADAILAAGWRPPHVPPTRDEIEARYANLPDDIARHQAQARAEGRPGLSPQEMSRLLPG